MANELTPRTETTDFLLYTTSEGNVKVEVFLHNETIWLTQKKMAVLFDVGVPAISKHLDNIYAEGELDKKSTISILETVQKEGNRDIEREQIFYNLDAIISVGYRVNSSRATQFRIWATKLLKEYIIKGFAMDDERLKNGRFFGKDYFEELLERVRSIRASERRIYQKIADIFAECSIDYDKTSETTRDFYATVQNKFHYAITGKTAAEIIYEKADAQKNYMGLITWKHSPKGRIVRSDAIVAKNYLSEKEIKQLERTISGFFDYIERLVEKKTLLTMKDLAQSVNKFLEFNDFKLLDDKGKVSFQEAEEKAFKEYEHFNKTQIVNSDFDQLTRKKLKGRN